MDLGLQGKVALISGGSRGIGRGIAEVLSAEGAIVAICARDESVLKNVASTIGADTGNEVLPVQADLTKQGDIARLVGITFDKFGRIDILVNSAGSSVFGYFNELSSEDWVSSFELKFFGYVRLASLVVPHMIRQSRGVIINIVGNAGRIPLAWHMPGGAANSALLNFTKTLSDQVGQYGIRVIAVNPGASETDRGASVLRFFAKRGEDTETEVRKRFLESIPMGRFTTVEDIGNAVAFLASDKASHITGTSLTIDGGVSRTLP